MLIFNLLIFLTLSKKKLRKHKNTPNLRNSKVEIDGDVECETLTDKKECYIHMHCAWCPFKKSFLI